LTVFLCRWRVPLVALALVIAVGAIELLNARPPVCPCGTVSLWHGTVQSPENSQQIADWYSFSHIIHGFLFYGAAWLALRGRPAWRAWALPLAVLIEGGWELLENSPLIIDRYREATIAFGYTGDSVLNSLCDIGWMIAGFWLAGRLPAWWTVALAIAFELMTLAIIRDNLTLNVLMLVWPVEAIRVWQSG
jgi:hypothetical protein